LAFEVESGSSINNSGGSMTIGAGDGDALLRPPESWPGSLSAEMQLPNRALGNSRRDLARRQAAHLQTEADVGAHAEMRKQHSLNTMPKPRCSGGLQTMRRWFEPDAAALSGSSRRHS